MWTHRPLWLVPTALLLMCGTASAWAQDKDTKETKDRFKLNAGYSRLSDSNPLRLSANPNATKRIGIPDTEDQINKSMLGFSFNTRQSLQQFELDFDVTDYEYQNFSNHNFTAHNYKAAWRWAVTPRLHGNFTTDRKESLNFDSSVPGASLAEDEGVPRTNTNTRFDALYEIDGVWRVLGGVSRLKSKSNATAPGSETDSEANSADLGLRYAFTSGSALTYTARTSQGNYLSNGALNESFSQRDNELRLHWILTGNTTADISAAHVNRTHPQNARLDYSGLNTGIKLNWNITGKTSLAAGWMRELASSQHDANSPKDDFNYNSTHVQTNRFSLGPVWKASAKTVVRLNYELAQRDFRGSPTGVDTTAQLSDTLRNTSLAVAWQPYRYLTLGASLQKTTRTSNLADLDYDSNMATLSAQFSY